MLFNFLKTTFRNLLKNRSYVIINLIGLSLSLACCIVGYLNYKFAADFDRNHENHSRIYKIQVNKEAQDKEFPYGISPHALGHAIKGQLSGITHYTRYYNPNMVLKKDLKIFSKELGFAEEDFFEMFSFPFKYGSKESFLEMGNIILSEETAIAFFGDTDPTGEIITVISDNGDQYPLIVGGVVESIPLNTSIRFDAITRFENYMSNAQIDDNNWKRFVAATFIMTESKDFPSHIEPILNDNYTAIQNEARDDWRVSSYSLVRMSDLGAQSRDIWANWLQTAPPPPAITTPFIMALLMLLIACFNFTNTSIAISSKRLKEIGIRKVMGSNRNQLILQFMGENLILSLLALILGLGIAYFIAPAYSAMWEFVDLKLNLTGNPEIYFFLAGLLVFTSLVAGAYPSIYISSYQPVKILRGHLTLGGTNVFSRILLTSQYALTVIALISSLAFTNNARYQESLDLGFEKERILALRVDNQSEYQKIRNEIEQMPGISDIAGTSTHIGRWNYGRTLRNGEKEIETGMLDFGIEYYDVMQLKLLKGRYFEEDLYDHDRNSSIIVNEEMVNTFGWEEPLGQVLQMDDTTRLTVVGVMKNFHMWGFWNPVNPMGIRLADREDMNFIVVKSATGNLKGLHDELEEKWYELIPDKPFTGSYTDQNLKESTLVNENITVMFTFLGLLALILSTIGLYTLVSLNIIKRIKEIGVRKVLGASVTQIIGLINLRFIWILVIAAILGAASSYFAIDLLMSSIWAYYKAVSFWTIAIPLFILFLVALGTSSGRILKAAISNPVDSLRYE